MAHSPSQQRLLFKQLSTWCIRSRALSQYGAHSFTTQIGHFCTKLSSKGIKIVFAKNINVLNRILLTESCFMHHFTFLNFELGSVLDSMEHDLKGSNSLGLARQDRLAGLVGWVLDFWTAQPHCWCIHSLLIISQPAVVPQNYRTTPINGLATIFKRYKIQGIRQ